MNKKRLRNLLILNLVVITIIGIFMSVKSSHFLNISDLPEDNFSRMMIVKSLSIPICNEEGEDCFQEESVLIQAYASGLIFKTDRFNSYILTAAHFCDPYNFPEYIFSETDIITRMTITNLEDATTDATILYIDHEYDLCLVSTQAQELEDIALSISYPVLGEKVYAIADPKTMSSKSISLHFEGAFSGCDNNDVCYFTMPATNGSSGSIVFNDNKNIPQRCRPRA